MSHSDFAFAKNDQKNDSNQQASAQHARDQQSENEMSDPPCQLLQLAKNQFNINRKVVLKNVTGTYNDVKKFLGERYKVKNILVSKKQRHAVVWLQDGSQAEEIVETFNGKPFLGFPAEVALYKNENFLCVAHLPLNIDDEDFLGIVSELGVTERVFLMRDNEGKSKGYGFVEYSHNYEKTKLACSLLDNKRMGSCQLHCEFLKGTILTFEALNSTCLLVDHLPPGYNNNKEFELLFAKPNEPIYCKLAFDNGHPLGFGIVEYDDYKKTEEAIKLVHGKAIDKFTIRVTYCLPGLSAIDAYEHHAKGLHDAGLLPNPKGNISLLGNPLSGDGLLDIPVDAVTDPAVKAILASNPEVLGKFQYVMSKLQNQQALQQKLGKPGVHGATPGMEDNPLLNPQLQVSILACLLAKELQDNQPDMLDNPMVMQYLKDKTNGDSGEDKLSLLGNPLLSQASHMLDSITHETSNEGPKNENEIQQLMKTTERSTPIPAEFKDFNSLLSAATGKPIKKEAEQSLDAGSLPGNINPMLALMIETQIKQQLQMVHAFSLIQTLTSGATGGSTGPPKLGLLGNAPPGFTPEGPHMGVSGAPGPQGNRRAALLGDGPPGMNIDPGNFGGHGRRGTHNQDTEDENRTQGVKRKNSHDSGPEDYPANSAQDQRGLGIPPEGAHQMYQMYQQYLQQFTKFMQKQKTEKSPSDEDDNSSAAYCSGIASKPAFSDDPNHWGQSEPYSNLGDNPLLNPAILAAAAALNPALLSSQGPPNIANPIGNQINPLQPHQHQNDRPNQKGYRFDNASMANNPNSRSFNFGNPTASNTRSFGNPNLQEAFRSNSRQGLSSQFGVNQKGYHFENPSSANNPNSQNFNFSNPSGSNTRNFGNPNQHKSFTSNERQGSSSQFGVNQNQKPPFNQNHNPGSNRQEGFSNRNTFNSFSQTPHNNQPQQQGSIHQEYNPVKQPLSFNQRQVPNTPQEYQNQRIAPTIPQGFNQPPSQPDSYSTRGSQLYDPSHPTPANSFNYGQKPKSDLPHSWSQNDRWSTGQISAIGTKPSSMNIQNHRTSQQYQGNQYDPHSTETPRVRHGRVENNSRISPIGTLTLGYPKINFQVTNNTSYTDLLVNVQEVIASARGLETKNTRNESAFEISKEKAFQAATPNIRNLKRSTLLPSPEPSPEGNYVGQHSQGLGGHYATSYLKRRKLHHYD